MKKFKNTVLVALMVLAGGSQVFASESVKLPLEEKERHMVVLRSEVKNLNIEKDSEKINILNKSIERLEKQIQLEKQKKRFKKEDQERLDLELSRLNSDVNRHSYGINQGLQDQRLLRKKEKADAKQEEKNSKKSKWDYAKYLGKWALGGAVASVVVGSAYKLGLMPRSLFGRNFNNFPFLINVPILMANGAIYGSVLGGLCMGASYLSKGIYSYFSKGKTKPTDKKTVKK